MSRRMYFSLSAGAATITPSGSWDRNIAAAVTKLTSPTKQNTALADTAAKQGGTFSGATRWMSFLSDPLRSNYTFEPADSVSIVIRCLEDSTFENAHLAFILRVMQGDTSTQRGLLTSVLTTTTEFSTHFVAATRIHATVFFVSTVSALAGDRLCIEVGVWGDTPANVDNVTLRFGDPTAVADFALTTGLTTDLDPWWEISADPVFTTDPFTATATPSIRLTLTPSGLDIAPATAAPSIRLSMLATTGQTAHTALLPGVSITDTFDRADTASSLGIADSGQFWSVLDGVWGISSNKAVLTTGAALAGVVLESGIADAIIQVTLNPVDVSQLGILGLLFRTQDASNTLGCRIDPLDGLLQLFRYQASGFSVLQAQAYTPSATSVLRVECVDTTIRCYVNGVLVITATGVTSFQTATKHGLYAFQHPVVTWNDFSINAYPLPLRIRLALAPVAIQGHFASAAPSIRFAFGAQGVGGTLSAGSTVVEMGYNASGSTVSIDQRIVVGQTGTSTFSVSQRE